MTLAEAAAKASESGGDSWPAAVVIVGLFFSVAYVIGKWLD